MNVMSSHLGRSLSRAEHWAVSMLTPPFLPVIKTVIKVAYVTAFTYATYFYDIYLNIEYTKINMKELYNSFMFIFLSLYTNWLQIK